MSTILENSKKAAEKGKNGHIPGRLTYPMRPIFKGYTSAGTQINDRRVYNKIGEIWGKKCEYQP